jgi:hypothetical protein
MQNGSRGRALAGGSFVAWRAIYRNDYWVPLEVEVVKARILYEDEEIRILWKAKLDVIFDTNQGIYPCDHKTSKQRRDIGFKNDMNQ